MSEPGNLREALSAAISSPDALKKIQGLIDEALDARKEVSFDAEFVCKKCGATQRPKVRVPFRDWNALKGFLQLAIEHTQGKAHTAPAPAARPKVIGSFQEMSDEELQALLEDSPNGETDSSPTEEAA